MFNWRGRGVRSEPRPVERSGGFRSGDRGEPASVLRNGVRVTDCAYHRFDSFKCAPGVRPDMKFQGRSTSKPSGGRRRRVHKKRKHEMGHEPTETELDEPRFKVVDARGSTEKIRALSTDTVNLSTGEEALQADIENVVENPANPNYVRRNIITKGAVIETPEGQARVTSRPGQSGQVSAVLLE
jgi:small subunit ribosomal protein S8e